MGAQKCEMADWAPLGNNHLRVYARTTMATDHDHPKAAPDELDHVRQFVNTLDLETNEEQFGDPAALHGWLAERDLIPDGDTLSDADVRQVRLMREALRKLLLAHNGAPLDPDAVDCVNSAAKSAELV